MARARRIARQHKERAIILALCGLFVSCLFSPFAIWQARKAKAGGVDATLWEVLGWVGLILGTLATIAWILILIGAL